MTTPLTRPLVLASASPRRAALLAQLDLAFTVCAAHLDEPPPASGEEILVWARRAAADKARAAAAQLPPDPALVLGADTVVVLPGGDATSPRLHGQPACLLGKPRDVDDARAMLRALSGRAHTVVSAFALLAHPEGTVVSDVATTTVRFRLLDDDDIDAYLATGEPLDKAGAYGIQGRGAVLVDGIDGDYYTVVGLPLTRFWLALAGWRG
jgi:septum formation protein